MDRLADYVIVREFPRGNHGRVFMAHVPPRLRLADPYLAVKVLDRTSSDEAFARIATELRLFAAVDSAHLVDVFEAGQIDGRLYYVMEYFADGSLGIRRRSFSREETLRAVAHAAYAAQSLHDAGVVHADIKPNNILLHATGAKLADLGLADEVEALSRRGGGTPVGSVEYMDPGIVVGEPPESASDVWALGVTLHQALTGQTVHGAIPDDDLLSALRHVATTAPRLAPGLQPGEREIVAACLASRRADRPNAAEVAAAVEALRPSDDEAVVDRPLTRGQQTLGNG